jgi:hypothetical protein
MDKPNRGSFGEGEYLYLGENRINLFIIEKK